jgi:replicative DNA helicase
MTNSLARPSTLTLLPPMAMDLEEMVLGAAMLERSGQIVILEKLSPEDFYSESNSEVFKAIEQLAHDGNPVDMTTVVNQLRRMGKIEFIGGAYRIADLTSRVSSAANIDYHCRVLMEKRMAREIIRFSNEMNRLAYNDTSDVFELLDQITAFPVQVYNKIKVGAERTVEAGVIAIAQDINTRQVEKVRDLTGIPSGYHGIDRLTLGWQDTDLIIIAARPSMGKTTLVLNIARNAAIDFKIPVAIFSLEMSYKQLYTKFVSMETGFDNRMLFTKVLNPLDIDHFMHSTKALVQAKIFIDDSASLNIMDFRVRCRRFVETHKVKLIIVDYLQLMKGEPHTQKFREQEISNISRGLKQTAKELNIPVIALSQLSREVDKRPLPRIPILSDLRESGTIEQDADIVAFLWRPAYYKIPGDTDDNGQKLIYAEGLTKVIFAKHRNGSTGEAYLAMTGKTSKFENLDDPYLIPAETPTTKKNETSEVTPF